ncbi:TetR/AcrR family transcriptional regulator [Scleromatobacter humisilvae]|uniref:TetR/AcrR family transcriptional regulator n=1 Tax=Scleromatobacter humisilvae TaxID=2897159 RepID=A0A9X1YGY3_9BURK|nr:TetR/AcrR family transcriptional regulator [Scleromatobacter humisilvae]MCK9686114.1 TetR/AcrR family transcriptional regulator [Scleromatobacter humisilvae]
MARSIQPSVPPHGKGQREAILAEAAALFALRGYHGTSMSDLAEACGLSKATLYHHYRDKSEVLTHIADGHVSRLVELCDSVERDPAVTPDDRLRVLVERFLAEYAEAQNSHRVLTEDVRFLPSPDRNRILDKERHVVQSFADAVAALRPDLAKKKLTKPLAMLLFGMLNWMFTWLRPNGALTHASVTPLVLNLFFDGVRNMPAPMPHPRLVRVPRAAPVAAKRASRARTA